MARRKIFQLPAAPAKSCGKNRYNSRNEAEKVAREQELIFANQNLKLNIYHCALCGGWHLTKNDGNAADFR